MLVDELPVGRFGVGVSIGSTSGDRIVDRRHHALVERAIGRPVT